MDLFFAFAIASPNAADRFRERTRARPHRQENLRHRESIHAEVDPLCQNHLVLGRFVLDGLLPVLVVRTI